MEDKLPQLPNIGDLVAGRFRIVSLLGTGGFGTVYRALQENIGRDVALKFLTPGIAKDPVNVERFRREAFHVSQLRHPNTITIYDYGQTEDGLIYMVMEILEGVSLVDAVQDEGAIAWPRAAHIFIQILKSLSEAHRRGLVHRDLKPENIYLCELFGEQDYVKVLDFGVAKMTLESDNDAEMKLTKAGRIFGTPMYMAPEQACAEPITPATDVYALGLLIFEMLTGQPPVTGRNRIDVIHKQIRDEVPVLTKEMIGTAMGTFIRKATEKKPNERFHDAAEMLEGFLSTLDNLNIRPSARGATRPEISISSLVPDMGEISEVEEIEMPLAAQNEDAQSETKSYPPNIALERMPAAKVQEFEATTEHTALSERLIKAERKKQNPFADRPHSQPRYEVPLVGRSNEINALGGFISTHLQDRAGVIALIEGENGLGKTRLVKSLADHFKRLGIDSCRGNCIASSLAMEPVREAFITFWGLKQSDRTQIQRTIFGDLSTLGLANESDIIVGFLNPESNADPAANNTGALFASLEKVIIKLCERKPFVLIIEDLQHADSATLEFIEFLSLTMQTQGIPLSILLTMRPDARVLNPNIDVTFRKLADRLMERFTRSRLRRLSGKRLVKLLDAILPLEQRLKERVGWLCQGVPLHAIQIIRYLQNEGQLKKITDPKKDLWILQVGSPRDINLPPDLMELMRLRVEQAIHGESEAVLRGLLEWLATLGMRTPVDLLRGVLHDNHNLESELGKLRDEGIIRQSIHHNLVCVEFDSSLLREGILRSLSERWESRRLHKDAAEAKTAFYQQRNIPIPLVEIAEHWRQAGEADLYRDTILASAQRSMSQRNLRGARDQFRELIDLLDRNHIKNDAWVSAHIASGELAWRFGEFGQAEDHYRHAVDLGNGGFELGRAIRGLGHILTIQSKFDEALSCFERALKLSEEHSDGPSLTKALVGISNINILSGDLIKNEPIVHQLEEMLVTLPTGEISGKVLLHLSQLAQRQGKLGRRYSYLVKARHHFEDARDKLGLSDVLFRLGGALSDPAHNAPDRYLKGKKVLKQALELKQELGDRSGVAETYRYSGQLELQFEHYDLADQLLTQALNLHKAIGVPLNIGATYMAIGLNKMFQTKLSEAKEHLNEALVLFQKIGDKVATSHALMNLGELAINEGDLPRAQELLLASKEEKESVGSHWALVDIQNHLAICAMWTGDYKEAESLLTNVMEIVDEKGTEEDRAIARSLLGLLWCFQGRLQMGALELGRSRADAEDLGIGKVSVFCQANAAFYAAITQDELTYDLLVESIKTQPFFYTLSQPVWLGLIAQLATNAIKQEPNRWSKQLVQSTLRFAADFGNKEVDKKLNAHLQQLESNP